MTKKTTWFVLGTLIILSLTGCEGVEEKLTDVSNMTVADIVSNGVDTGISVWNESKEILENLDKDSLVYVSQLSWHSIPLAAVYVELNLLYLNPETYNPNEWTTLFERNHQRIVDTKTNIEGLIPTEKLQGLHDSYVSLLTHTIALNEKALAVVGEGAEITTPLVEEFRSLQYQYEEINSLLEQYFFD